jgi:hypothetical protein
MHRRSLRIRLLAWAAALALPLALMALSAVGSREAEGSTEQQTALGDLLPYLSQSIQVRYWLAHPDQAPPQLRGQFHALSQATPTSSRRSSPAASGVGGAGVLGDVFNRDTSGFPQDEESVAVCHANPRVVLGATNDYRGLVLDPQQNITGWQLSTNRGRSVTNEGLLPALPVAGRPGRSSGDPVVAADGRCDLFAGDLNGVAEDPSIPDGVGVYRSSPGRLAACPGGSAPWCWPTRRVVAVAAPGHLVDKPWLDVGRSGAAGRVVWVVYSDLRLGLGGQGAGGQLTGVRCDVTLDRCTAPIPVGINDELPTQGDVTVAPDGRVYVTWADIVGLVRPNPRGIFVVHKLRVAQPGQTAFGPTRVINVERRPLPPRLHADDAAVLPPTAKHAVRMVAGKPRVFFTWEGCRAKAPLLEVCEEPQIKLRSSQDLGATWSRMRVLSAGGDNYFPAIANDPAGSRLALTWYTNRFDPRWHHRQDLELVGLDPATGAVSSRQRVTPISNEPDADPFWGGTFIGDYIEVDAHGGVAYLHYTMNYRRQAVLGQGFAINQQDNYLTTRHL